MWSFVPGTTIPYYFVTTACSQCSNELERSAHVLLCSDLLLRRFLHNGGGDCGGGPGYNACANRWVLRVHIVKTILFVLVFLCCSLGELGLVSRRTQHSLEYRAVRPACASEEDAALTTPYETLKARLCATFRPPHCHDAHRSD